MSCIKVEAESRYEMYSRVQYYLQRSSICSFLPAELKIENLEHIFIGPTMANASVWLPIFYAHVSGGVSA